MKGRYQICHHLYLAQVIVRNLEKATVDALKARAAAQGRSLEQELRQLLAAAASPTRSETLHMADSIRALSQHTVAVDLNALLREDRDR